MVGFFYWYIVAKSDTIILKSNKLGKQNNRGGYNNTSKNKQIQVYRLYDEIIQYVHLNVIEIYYSI